jgi:glycosyltransferase involved in cell wall biosynthesis
MRSGRHIVWVIPGFAASEEDDATIPASQKLALEFKKNYPDILLSIITLHFPFKEGMYKWNGIDVHALGGKNISFPLRFLLWRKALKKISELDKIQKIDLVHSFWLSESAALASLFCNKRKIPHLCTAIGQSVRKGNRYLKLLNIPKIYTIAESQRADNTFEQHQKIKCNEIIPWGIDSFEKRDHERTIDIIGVGSLSSVKNFSLFMEILAIVKAKFPLVKAYLAGDGEEMQMLKDLSEKLGLKDNLIFSGWKRREEVMNLMQQSKILLHTSSFEGYGYIFAEAAACGCHVVSTPVGAAENNSYSFTSSDKSKLAEKIVDILSSSHTFAQRKVLSMQECAEKYAEAYNRLMTAEN